MQCSSSIVILLALVTLASAQHNLSMGHREPGDKLFEEKEFRKGGRPWSIDEQDTISGKYWITFVDIIDLKDGDNSGTPFVLSGGPGHTYVALKFENKRFHGINFLVKVYGKPVS